MLNPSSFTRLRPFMVIACLLAYICSATHLLPAVTAAVAWLDGEHYVSLVFDEGSTKVVLRHDQTDGARSLQHSHCVVARAITALAEPNSFHSDHVLNFNPSSDSVLRSAAPRCDLADAGLLLAPMESGRGISSHISDCGGAATLLSLPPPDQSVVVARTVVLLV